MRLRPIEGCLIKGISLAIVHAIAANRGVFNQRNIFCHSILYFFNKKVDDRLLQIDKTLLEGIASNGALLRWMRATLRDPG